LEVIQPLLNDWFMGYIITASTSEFIYHQMRLLDNCEW